MKVQQVVTQALKTAGILGVGQTPLAEDANDAFLLLNSMLASWSQNRWLVNHLVDVSCQSNGAQSYTIGPGGDFNTTRPDSIEAAYASANNSQNGSGVIDFTCDIVHSYEQYASVMNKNVRGYPAVVFYDSGYPLGKLYFFPMPTLNFILHVVIKAPIGNFTSLNSDLNLPPEYNEAILWNLAARLKVAYGMQPVQGITQLALGSLAIIKAANFQMQPLQMPGGLGRRSSALGTGSFNSPNGRFALNRTGLA